MTGPGRSLFVNGDTYDGFYKGGKFHGLGVYYKSESDQYLYGNYEYNECVQALTLGNGYPHEMTGNYKEYLVILYCYRHFKSRFSICYF